VFALFDVDDFNHCFLYYTGIIIIITGIILSLG